MLAAAALAGSAVRYLKKEKTKEREVTDPRKAKNIFKNLRLFIDPPVAIKFFYNVMTR